MNAEDRLAALGAQRGDAALAETVILAKGVESEDLLTDTRNG